MKPLLKRYLALGIIVLFAVAAAVDYCGFMLGDGYLRMGTNLPGLSLFAFSIRHWAFALPVTMLVLTVVLFARVRSERILLHLFGGMMMTAIIVIATVSVGFFLPLFATNVSLWQGE